MPSKIAPQVKVKKPNGVMQKWMLVPESEAQNYEPWTDEDERALRAERIQRRETEPAPPQGSDEGRVPPQVIPPDPARLQTPVGQAEQDALIRDLLALPLSKLEPVLATYEDADALQALLSREQGADRPRVTVLKAIQARIDALS